MDLSWYQAVNSGTVQNSAGTNAVIPVVDGTYAGLMAPAEHTKLAGIQAGAQVNPDLSNYLQNGDNVSSLTNDANYITAADVPAQNLQSVLNAGNTSTTDLWIGTGGQTVKLLNTGTVETSGAVQAGGMNSGYFTGTVLNSTGSVSVVNRTGGNLMDIGYYFNSIENKFVVDQNANLVTDGIVSTKEVQADEVVAISFRVDLLPSLP